MNSATLLDAAQGWREAGYVVMAASGKRPLRRGWQSVSPEDHFSELSRQEPEQIAIRTGEQRDGWLLLVLDVDGEIGEQSLRDLERRFGELPSTQAQRTPRGGRHLLFQWPQERAGEMPTVSAGKLGSGLDVRGRSGCIIAAPSPGTGGQKYELSPDDVKRLPDAWVSELVRVHAPSTVVSETLVETPPAAAHQPTDAVERCRRYVARMDPALSGSGGHVATWRVAQVATRGFGLSRSDALSILREYNQRCEPHWSEAELSHKVESAEQKSKVPRGHLLDRGDWSPSNWDPKFDAQPEATGTELRGNVRELRPASSRAGGQVRADNSKQRFAFPTAPEQLPLREPAVQVPDPDVWYVPPGPPSPPSFPHKPNVSLKHCVDNEIAKLALSQLDRMFVSFVHGGDAFYCYEHGSGVFKQLDLDWVKKVVEQFDGARSEKSVWSACPRRIGSVVELIRLDVVARQASPCGRSYFDGAKALVAFENGTFIRDPHTGATEFRDNSPEWRALHKFDFAYEADRQPEWLLRVLREDTFAGVPDEERELRILALRQFYGHALLGSQPFTNQHKGLFKLGGGGDFKSGLLEILKGCMPPGAYCSIQPAGLTKGVHGGENARASLLGKTLNVVDDCSAEKLRDTSALKSILSFGDISARSLGGNTFTFTPRATSIFSGNELPETGDRTQAFARRFLVLEFPNSIDPSHMDGLLARKILSRERAEFVCWCASAAIEMLRDRTRFSEPECSAQLVREWLGKGDHVSGFISGATQDAGPDRTAWPSIDEVYAAFADWMRFIHENQAERLLPHKGTFSKTLARLPGVAVERVGRDKISRVNRRVKTDDD